MKKAENALVDSSSLFENLNVQMNLELQSAFIYLYMASWARNKGFIGFAKYYEDKAGEEKVHADKFYKYLNDRNVVVTFDVPPLDVTIETIVDTVQASYDHENKITSNIYFLYDNAKTVGDYATMVLLEWYISEQVEEMAYARELVDRCKIADGNTALLLIDGGLK